MQLINTGFIINKFFVKAKAKNIAVIGVREHPATKAPIPAKIYVLGACQIEKAEKFDLKDSLKS